MDSIKISPKEYLEQAELIHSAQVVEAAINQLASRISASLSESNPIVLCVMGGAVVFAGQLLPRLNFPLAFDYVQVSRYHNQTQGRQLVWKVMPKDNVRDRTYWCWTTFWMKAILWRPLNTNASNKAQKK